MVLDTSAITAILLGEPEVARMVEAVAAADRRLVGAPTLVEAVAILFARAAYQRFGKVVGSPGVPNYGDCLAYGVAMARGQALLFEGEDFPRTVVMVAPD